MIRREPLSKRGRASQNNLKNQCCNSAGCPKDIRLLLCLKVGKEEMPQCQLEKETLALMVLSLCIYAAGEWNLLRNRREKVPANFFRDTFSWGHRSFWLFPSLNLEMDIILPQTYFSPLKPQKAHLTAKMHVDKIMRKGTNHKETRKKKQKSPLIERTDFNHQQ